MAISPYIAELRTHIGTSLLLVPTVAVLPRDGSGRILLVRHTESDRWATIGGTVEPDEAPEDAAVREALEEANVVVRLTNLVAALGGADYRITYPNGDRVACVAIVYDARVESGTPAADGDETSEVGWFHPYELTSVDLNDINRHLLDAAIPLLSAGPARHTRVHGG